MPDPPPNRGTGVFASRASLPWKRDSDVLPHRPSEHGLRREPAKSLYCAPVSAKRMQSATIVANRARANGASHD